MNIHNINLEMTAGRADQFPVDEIPEIAFVGRSNVGKSSLLNTMLNRKGLARISSAPGKTRTVNFYNIDNTIRFVDLPGYGYASVSKGKQESWLKVIDQYLNDRPNLKCVALLLDCRRVPSKEDKLMLGFIAEMDYNFIIPITKTDKLSRNELFKNMQIIKKELQLSNTDMMVQFSSLKKVGKDELWAKIEEQLGMKD